MSPKLAEARQRWYDSIQPGTLVRYNQWSAGYTNKPALIVSIDNTTVTFAGPSRRSVIRKQYVILVDEITRSVYQDLISPLDGWSSLIQKKS
jgi:hypothetical protein